MSDNVINFPTTEDGKLTEENVDAILDKINEVTEGQELPTRDYTEDERTGYSEDVTVSINPLTGERVLLNETEDEYITAELSDFVSSDFNIELDDSTIEATLKGANVTTVEMTDFLALVKEYKANDGKVPNIYNRLPAVIKAQVDKTLAESGGGIALKDLRKVRTMISKDLLESFINDAEFDQMSVDLNKQIDSIVKEYSAEMADLYKGSINEKIEELTKISESLLEKGERDKSDNIAAIVDALKESYEMDIFKESIARIKIKAFDMEKPSRLFDAFKFKYKDSKFTIQDPSILPAIIDKHTECGYDKALNLVLAYCKYCQNFQPDTNIAQHTFMYYFIANIVSLNIIAPDKEYDEFSQKIVDNLRECLRLRDK